MDADLTHHAEGAGLPSARQRKDRARPPSSTAPRSSAPPMCAIGGTGNKQHKKKTLDNSEDLKPMLNELKYKPGKIGLNMIKRRTLINELQQETALE